MNKLLKGLLASVIFMGLLVGCGEKDKNMKKVAIIQLVEHTSLNTIKSAFDERMKELGYEDGVNVEYIFKNAQGDNNTAASIIQEFKGENPDVIMAIATPVAQSAATLSKDIPVVFAAVSDPIGAKLTTSLKQPDKNITGTSDEIQVELILDKALQVNPQLKKLGVIYNKGEANSITNIKKAKDYCDDKGIRIEEATVTNVNEIQSAVDVLSSQCDAIFVPNDNTVASAMNVVSSACIKAKIPLYVGADSMVQDGGFLSVGINYENLGKETADMVNKVLKGTAISNIPVKVFKEDLNIYVNEKVLKELDISLPESIKNDKALFMMK
ncbi:MAG: ABC transporter substrate-binding protein [Coprobacillus sp.]|nr:ABC transporter substrate-binding protein [Coprobacillus sp.]